MANKQFFSYLLLVAFISLAAVWALSMMPQISSFKTFSFTTIALFVMASIALYFIAKNTAKSTNLGLYSTVSLAFGFTKMLLSVGLLVAYFKLAQPEQTTFIFPFLLVYLIFLIFETYFLTKIGKGSA